MRALDWDSEAPMSEYPVVGIYNFTDGKSYPFANFAWAGIVGSLAGMSANMGVCEQLWSGGEKENVTSEYGEPWMYVLRDIL